MIRIDRRKALILLSVVVVAAILGSMVLVYGTQGFAGLTNKNNEEMMPKACGWPHGYVDGNAIWLRGWKRRGFIEVSEEFKDKVINIAKSDPDMQKLLADGYNITGVRPIIKAKVEANGDVVIKATSAIVMLRKDTTGSASVWVDLEKGKVTEIVILTRTVIKKP